MKKMRKNCISQTTDGKLTQRNKWPTVGPVRARARAMAIHENRPAGPDRNLVTPTTLFFYSSSSSRLTIDDGRHGSGRDTVA